MKKFLMPILLALALLLPTAIGEAADVPDFRQVAGNHVTFTGKEVANKGGYVVYGYDCSVDLNENFAEQFMNLLMENYSFRYVNRSLSDFRKSSATLYERWYFDYTGSKQVSRVKTTNTENPKNPYYSHVVIGRSWNWQTGIKHFSIKIANGLTYGGD